MSEELHKFRLKQDKQNCDSGKVPNNTKKCFVQGQSYTVIPYILFLLVQCGKMSPYHKSETSDGDASRVEVVLHILVYVDISHKYTGGKGKNCVMQLGFVDPYLRRPHHWVQRECRHRLEIDLEQCRSSIAITRHPVRSI